MKSVFYWSPCLSKVGTVKSTINSAISLSRYSKNEFQVSILNACGEWDEYKDHFKENKIEVIDLFSKNYFKYLPKEGYLFSRFSYLLIFILSFFPLLKIIKKKNPKYLIMHLITSLPLSLMCLFKFETKFILRISGYPKLNFFRKFFWKICANKIEKITCPSLDLIKKLKDSRIFINDKLTFLPDAIIDIKKFIKQIKSKKNDEKLFHNKNYFIAVGRLTKQKNFQYLIEEFYKFSKRDNNFDLIIFGEGEERKKLSNLIRSKDLNDRVFLKGHSKEIYQYMKKASAFILSSLWEAPGFVIIEAALCNLFLISSDCPNGPKEILLNGDAGMLFESNKKDELKNKLEEFINSKESVNSKKISAKKNCMKYTIFRHYLYLRNII